VCLLCVLRVSVVRFFNNLIMKIILIRHGQTGYNKEKIFRGKIDVPLDSTGILQTKAIAEKLSSYNIKAIYSSPLKRALETSTPIAATFNLDVEIDDKFVDFDFGEWQGLGLEEVQKKFPDLYCKWLKEPHLVKIPNGESLGLVRERVTEVINRIIEKNQDTTAIVSHRVINKVIICAMLSLDNSHFWQIKQDVGAINVIEYKKGMFIVVSLNDTCHLEKFKQNKKSEDF